MNALTMGQVHRLAELGAPWSQLESPGDPTYGSLSHDRSQITLHVSPSCLLVEKPARPWNAGQADWPDVPVRSCCSDHNGWDLPRGGPAAAADLLGVVDAEQKVARLLKRRLTTAHARVSAAGALQEAQRVAWSPESPRSGADPVTVWAFEQAHGHADRLEDLREQFLARFGEPSPRTELRLYAMSTRPPETAKRSRRHTTLEYPELLEELSCQPLKALTFDGGFQLMLAVCPPTFWRGLPLGPSQPGDDAHTLHVWAELAQSGVNPADALTSARAILT